MFHTSSGKAGSAACLLEQVFVFGDCKYNNNQSFRSTEPAWFISKYRVLHRSSNKDFPCMLNSFNFHFSLLTITL